MAQYDISSKVLYADYERDFIAFALGTEGFEILEPIPVELPSVQMRITDAPMKVRLSDGTEAIVLIEFQTETSTDAMEYRIAEYVGRLLHEHQLPVYVTVIYLAATAGASDPGGLTYNLGNTFAYGLRYQVIRMSEIDGQAIVNQKSPVGLVPFTPLMKRPEDVTKADWLERCVDTVLQIPLESAEKRRDYVASFCVLANLVYEDNVISTLVKEVQTMIDLENSVFIKMFTEKDREKVHDEGSRTGRLEAYTDALLQIIKQEFGNRGVRELEPHISAIEDEKKLARLITLALQASSVEALKQVLSQLSEN